MSERKTGEDWTERPGLIALGAALVVLVVGGVALLVGRRGASVLPKPALPAGSTVVLLGDSLGVGIRGPLESALGAAGIALVSGPEQGWNARQTASRLLGSDAYTGDAYVLSLGSNDGAQLDPSLEAPDVQAIVDTAFARGATRFIWVVPPNFSSPSPPPPASPAKQQAFAALWADPRVEQLVAPTDYLAGDGIHLSPAGYTDLANRIAAALV